MPDPIKILFEEMDAERLAAIKAAVARQEQDKATSADRVLLAYDLAMCRALVEIEEADKAGEVVSAMDICSVCEGRLDMVGTFRQPDGRGGMKHTKKEDCGG